MTFKQFLTEKEKTVKLYGVGTKPPAKLFAPVNPAKPAKPMYTGMSVQQVLPVPRAGNKNNIMGS